MSELRSAYSPHKRVQAIPVGKSRTKQAMREESDMNIIMARYEKTGLLDHANEYGPRYAAMPSQTDFHEAMNLVTEAQQMFADLPAGARSQFENDPAKFLDFMADPEKFEEQIEMGLRERAQPAVEPVLDIPVPPVPETPPPTQGVAEAPAQ